MEKLRILKLSPLKAPEVITIPHSLEAMQTVVGGYIQATYPFEDPVAIICNEEGKLTGEEPNRAILDPETGEILDVICGTFFICGLATDDFASLTDSQIQYYSKLFRHPELFLWSGSSLVVLPMEG